MYLFIYLQSELHATYEFNIIKTNKKQKIEIQCKDGVKFSFEFGCYSIHLGFVCEEQGGVKGFLLNRQNLLSKSKVIC